MVIALGASALLLAGVILLIPLGLRDGDQPDDALVLDVEPLARSRGAVATVTNPEDAPVLLGLSLRRAGLRQRLEGPSYVRIRSGRTSTDLLAGTQACIGVVEAGETATFALAPTREFAAGPSSWPSSASRSGLRTVHRLVLLTQEAGCNEATIAANRPAGMLSVRMFDTQ